MRQKTYGKNRIGQKPPPAEVIKVQIIERKGSKHIRSRAFSVYGVTYEEILKQIEKFLREQYD